MIYFFIPNFIASIKFQVIVNFTSFHNIPKTNYLFMIKKNHFQHKYNYKNI